MKTIIIAAMTLSLSAFAEIKGETVLAEGGEEQAFYSLECPIEGDPCEPHQLVLQAQGSVHWNHPDGGNAEIDVGLKPIMPTEMSLAISKYIPTHIDIDFDGPSATVVCQGSFAINDRGDHVAKKITICHSLYQHHLVYADPSLSAQELESLMKQNDVIADNGELDVPVGWYDEENWDGETQENDWDYVLFEDGTEGWEHDDCDEEALEEARVENGSRGQPVKDEKSDSEDLKATSQSM